MIHNKKVVWLAALPVLVVLPVSAAPLASTASPASATSPVATTPQAVKAPKKFLTPTGRIVYRMTSDGSMAMNNTIIVTWTNYGQKFRQDMQMRVDISGVTGAKQNQPFTVNTWTIYDGQYLYNVLPGAHKIIRMKLPQSPLDQMPGLGSLGSIGAGSLGASGEVVGHATLLGKPATIRAVTANTPSITTNAKLWMWGNLPLRAEMVMHFKPIVMPVNTKDKNAPRSFQAPPTNVTMVATNLDVSVKSEPSLFRLPAGYAVQDRSEFMKQLQQKMQAQRPGAGSHLPPPVMAPAQ